EEAAVEEAAVEELLLDEASEEGNNEPETEEASGDLDGEPEVETPARGERSTAETDSRLRERSTRHTPSLPPPGPSDDTEVGGVEPLYRAAHEAHFRGDDPARALAAWDAYLAGHPEGRLATEARYNRALTLIRLGRHRSALAALEPFRRPESGYRREEAEQLGQALEARLEGALE
ncbi:MAG: hypothetical protein AAGF12_24850, partial [Myxococcota bacterium]